MLDNVGKIKRKVNVSDVRNRKNRRIRALKLNSLDVNASSENNGPPDPPMFDKNKKITTSMKDMLAPVKEFDEEQYE